MDILDLQADESLFEAGVAHEVKYENFGAGVSVSECNDSCNLSVHYVFQSEDDSV